MTTSVPRISVVVATYNRAQLLPRLVAALERQDLDHRYLELIVVDDGSSDDTGVVLAALAADASFSLAVLSQPRNSGPAAARNAGWAVARGEVIAFTDDDCEPSSRWLRAGLEQLEPGTYVVGKTEPARDQLQAEGPFSRTLRVGNAKFMQTCNIFYRRVDLDRLGGFDERLRTAEDTDLGFRALELGIVGIFAPEALVEHDVRPSSLPAALRDACRWVDVPWVVKRQGYSEYQSWKVFWKPSHAVLFVALIAIVLGVVLHPIALLGVLPWIRRNLVVDRKRFPWHTRLLALPGSFLVDLTEMITMIRGSIRHRILLL